MITIRAMQPEDLEIVCQLYLAANPFTNVADIRAWTEADMQANAGLHFVAEHNGALVGAISGSLKGSVGTVEDVAVVLPRAGIGSQLTAELMCAFEARGVRTVLLWTHWKCAAAVPFHYANGFRLVRVERTKGVPFVPDGEDILVLEREL